MKKLTIEHLAAYLPYGLKFQSGHFLVGLYDGSSDVVRPMLMSESKHGCIDWEANFNMDKPILRPLSDLTREITHNGEKFVPNNRYPLKYFVEADLECFIDNISTAYYHQIQYLHSLHFDTFGLIEAGLAIDINTLTNAPD